MFAKLSSSVDRTADFCRRHRTVITIAATAVVCYKVHASAVEGWNEFLEENDLTDKFYLPGE